MARDIHPFETFEHTADIGLAARGRTLEELFENAALGLVDLMVDPAGLREETRLEVSVSAQDRDALLVAWLNELLYVLDARGFLPRRCRVTRISDTDLTAELWGERVDRERHQLRRLVKAATYHGLRVANTNGRWEARVILDL
ncbi:MAG TPA: archease [bacterium]|nr:archease [bacterium]